MRREGIIKMTLSRSGKDARYFATKAADAVTQLSLGELI
jgi:hypothetical protein